MRARRMEACNVLRTLSRQALPALVTQPGRPPSATGRGRLTHSLSTSEGRPLRERGMTEGRATGLDGAGSRPRNRTEFARLELEIFWDQ